MPRAGQHMPAAPPFSTVNALPSALQYSERFALGKRPQTTRPSQHPPAPTPFCLKFRVSCARAWKSWVVGTQQVLRYDSPAPMQQEEELRGPYSRCPPTSASVQA